jgi:hypothetical protein
MKRQPIPLTFTFEDICEGFMKWREGTTTSPSGKRLGMYRLNKQIMLSQPNTDDQSQLLQTSHEFL